MSLLGAIERELGDWLIAVSPSAGIHLYARYRDRRQTKRMMALAAHHAIGAQPTSDFLIDRQTTGASGIAFGFGCIDEADIERAILRFASALRGG